MQLATGTVPTDIATGALVDTKLSDTLFIQLGILGKVSCSTKPKWLHQK